MNDFNPPYDDDFDEDDEFDFNEKDVERLVDEFRESIKRGSNDYFEDDEIEAVIMYALSTFNFSLADQALSYAIKTYPSDSYFRILKVRRHLVDLDADSAEAELDKMQQLFPPSCEYYLQRSLLMKLRDDNCNIIGLLRKAEMLDPDNTEVMFLFASEYVRRHNIQKAFEYTEKAIKSDPAVEEQLFTLSILFEETKQFEEAIEFFTLLTNSFPLSIDVWASLSLAYSANKEYDKSIEANKYVLSINDKVAAAYFNIGNAYFELGKYDEALENYNAACEIDNEDFFAITCIGDCYYEMKDNAKAMEYYHRAHELNPEHVNAIIGILTIFDDEGRKEEAELFLEKIFSAESQSLALLFSTMSFYKSDMQIDKIKHLFELSTDNINIQHKNEIFKMLTSFCCNNEEYNLGIEILSDYLDEEYPDVPYLLAALHYLNHNFAEGQKYLQIALLTNPQNAEMFLQIDPVLATYPEISDLINLYKQ